MKNVLIPILCDCTEADRERLVKVARYISKRDGINFFDFAKSQEIYDLYMDADFNVDDELEVVDPQPASGTGVKNLRNR